MKNSDYLYLDHAATTPMREVALKAFIEAEKDVSFLEIDSPHGHDAFLMPSETYDSAIETFLEKNE